MTSRPPRSPRRRPGRRLASVTALLASLALLSLGATPALAAAPPAQTAAADPGTPIDPAQYSLVGADSQSPAYPAPPALDGTALAAFDNDTGTQWTVAYDVVNGTGVAKTPMPHWLTLDVGGSFTLTGLDYSVKKQDNGPVKDFKVYVTDDAATAKDPNGDWGAPAATGSFHQPAADTDVQTVVFDKPVKGRYVRFEADSAVNGSDNASASELRVRAIGDTTPAPVTPPPPAHPATPVPLSRGGLTVQVAKEFPQVVSYAMDGGTLGGQASVLDTFDINGKAYTATTAMRASGDTATYTSTFAGLPNVTITSAITVTAKRTVVFEVKKIAGSAARTVDELSIPDQSLVSVDTSDPHANLARTRISTDSTTTADQFTAVNGATTPDPAPVGTPYGFVGNSRLSAGLLTDATDDAAQDDNDNGNSRLQSRIVDAGGGARRAELSVGNYTYAPKGATDPRVSTYTLPRTTVVLAGDANGDGEVTWEDGAIAYRDAMTHPLGADRVPERVVQHIPFNFASEATNPFLKTLDNVKRISLATDDLGQWVLEKGYANEGHDSGHPDYGGDYNVRAGGLGDLDELAAQGEKYNADLAVHVNVTEAYPQAKNFSSGLVQGQVNGWDWLNQSYHIDQRTDLGTGAILDRFAELRKQAPGIKTVYIDAYYSSGWLADELATQLHTMGFEVASEWAYKFEGESIWSHWASDKNYGDATNKGINSDIIRFIGNSDRDVWNVDPLLGGSDIKEFEGWTGQDDWNAFYDNIFSQNLPTKFLQHYQVTDWDFGKSAELTGGVRVAMDDGVRQITMGGALVLKGDSYLLPWGEAKGGDGVSSPSDADKMYAFSASGGAHTFDLTAQFAGSRHFTLYKLTDTGRVKAADVTPVDGRVTLTTAANQPYVLVPAGGRAPHTSVDYGQGTGLSDPGFNAGNLTAWHPTGGAAVARTADGDNVARLGTGAASGISQQVKGLKPGKTYTLGADVEIAKGQRRTVDVTVGGTARPAVNSFDTTPAPNEVAADAKEGTYAQRASVTFTAPPGGRVTVGIAASPGAAAVTLDDVRLMADTSVPVLKAGTRAGGGTVVAAEDFEGNQPGWGPFVKGDAGGITDPRTSISDLHAPYSQKAWKNTYSPYDTGTLKGQAVDDVIGGDHSLKSHEENTGLVYRTVPATVPFVAGHAYRVSFRYQTDVDGQWAWVTGADTVGGGEVTSKDLTRDTLAPALDTATYSKDIVAGCGDTWVGLRKLGGAAGTDFVLDDFTVTDLGPSATGPACASVTVPPTAELSPGTPSEYTTTFTNNEAGAATGVRTTLDGLPAGWTAAVEQKGGNAFASVAPGATATTTWLLTAPAGAAGTTAQWKATATYTNGGDTKTVTADAKATVASRALLPPGSMTATADSENRSSGAAEGPVANVLDGDPGTIWHTDYTDTEAPYPHWVTLKLSGPADIDGFGYLDRQSGGPNGRIGDYEIAVSDDGTTWTTVTHGTLADSPQTQQIDFTPVRASYVRFTGLDALNGLPFAAAAEMRVYGSYADPPVGYPPQ
ncbi:endo-alpha-N-acetylgalactosaminidase [Actinacidiphila yanglinensis]|uniref:Endo-alpha-N-acetylgalactosaminidase n=1 Tax=Actinacidiphila yanglinensis TaxID=310779 RepID=A0A1H6DXW2_9ACTN|nr:endo-alpha-N-acetylgalactosaminidase family protein [Actinacidiphila yanglinensis]SEG89894.1 endo-alpha-N-acetylgalactosaminidase [Actinacidiphila yanglinensis]